ncbi:MAG: hypothetical protein H6851_12985 [Geminicoccaceae bacterium]|nr:hypothetical protein [Geminicoccaceae bacterium]
MERGGCRHARRRRQHERPDDRCRQAGHGPVMPAGMSGRVAAAARAMRLSDDGPHPCPRRANGHGRPAGSPAGKREDFEQERVQPLPPCGMDGVVAAVGR